jgi:DEAD/DEAH box helicase domain-containing protein
MNPILLGKQVEDGLKDLVLSSFETSSPAYAGMIDSFLEADGNFLKGPWITVDLPFRSASSNVEPFPAVPLGFQPHRHQDLAFARLRAPNAKSTLVATGTGSGKTECYLWPILDACRTTMGQPGIKAIIVYPMNALASDQARRIAKAIHKIPALAGVRCGIYADAEPNQASETMSEVDVITSREAMLQQPPDILLTNYKMLDYLLLRGRDKRLWAQNSPNTLRYLVVDELHTFDGAQGADLALLIRRLKARLKTPEGHLACVGSSATLGTGKESEQRLIKYASDLFGEAFEPDSVIREDRLEAHEYLGRVEYADLPDPQALQIAVEHGLTQNQGAIAQSLARLFFEEFDPRNVHFDTSIPDDPNAPEWRLALGARLKEHVAFHRVLEALQTKGRASSLGDAVNALSGARLLRDGWSESAIAALVEAVVILTAWGRSGDRKRPMPLLSVRVQVWAREMGRMVAGLPTCKEDGTYTSPTLSHSLDLDDTALLSALPVIHCRHCGTTGQIVRVSPTSTSVWAPLEALYAEFFEGGNGVRFVYCEPIRRANKSGGYGAVVVGYLDPTTLVADWSPHRPAAKSASGELLTPVWMFDPVDGSGRVDRTCPACGNPHSVQILGLRSARLSASLSTTLFNSEHHEVEDEAKPRVLIFSDSVQDAAQRAAVSEIRNIQTVFRKALYRGVTEAAEQSITLADLMQRWVASLRKELGEANFIARFIARDQTWRQAYVDLVREGKEPGDPKLGHDVALRLGWEFFSDLTYRSRTSQTLETARLAVADIAPSRIKAAADVLQPHLIAHVGSDFALDDDEAIAFLTGLCTHLRRAGAVAHPYVAIAAQNATNRGPNYFASQNALGVGKLGVLPRPDQRTSAAPILPTLRTQVDGFLPVSRDTPTNWYRAWANRFFGRQVAMLGAKYSDLYSGVFDVLANAGLLLGVEGGPNPVKAWLIPPEAITVSSRVKSLRCDQCGRLDTFLDDGLPQPPLACLRIGCEGNLLPQADDSHKLGPSRFLRSVMETHRNHRVVAREHTGILETDDRRALEAAFIQGEKPWDPNLISATPTLEMGIDIGDLSTLLLSSMPPEEANYVQRIGRTGRRDGNSLNVTLIAARSHDLQFWADPSSMLAGQVTAPGVHLQAVAVLKRQAAAFALDQLVCDTAGELDYGNVNSALATLERDLFSDFPLNWFHHLKLNGPQIADAFVGILPSEVSERADLVEALRSYLLDDGAEGLRYNIRRSFDAIAEERQELLELQKHLDLERRRLRNLSPPPLDLDDQLEQLKRRRAEISRGIRETINQVQVLQFLTDRGLLPNYAFPEEGVKLKSIIVRSNEGRAGDASGESDLMIKEYVRPASSALSELALDQTFYAEGRQVTIDRIDLRTKDITGWRFCPNCTYTEFETTAAKHTSCPQCMSPMWADTGARAEAVELRTVVATSTEQKAAIRDLDDRTARRYDRETFPYYEASSVEHAYAIQGGSGSAPFGYEFVPLCEFKDVNFGLKIAARAGQNIAGQQRQSRPFPICRRCGKLQHDRHSEHGDHQARCPADKGGEPRATWEAPIYLMRQFETEALRLIVPVAGRAQYDDIKSFVAAIELGLKKYFAGRVDHLRNVVVEEKLRSGASVRSLYLYDSIPGGSGYLRQLASHPQTMHKVFQLAAVALRDCPCAADTTKNGCFRCVKPYRSQFGPGEPLRDLALQLVEAVLNDWSSLVRVETAINYVLGADLVESELEARFLDKLRQTFGHGSLKPLVLDNGRRGFQLRVQAGGVDAYWHIEPQVQVAERFTGLPFRRVDFLMTRVGSGDFKPLVIELDGWEYHAKKIAEDIETRLLMIRSGRVEVWTLTWDDLETKSEALGYNPVGTGKLSAQAEGAIAQLLAHPQFERFRPYGDMINRIRTHNSADALMQRLRSDDWQASDAALLLTRMGIGPGAQKMSTLTAAASLNQDARLFLGEAALFGELSDVNLCLLVGFPNGGPDHILAQKAKARVVLSSTITGDLGARLLDTTAKLGWQGLWRLINLLQDLPGLHVTFPDLNTLDAPSATKSAGPMAPPPDGAWAAVAAVLDEEMSQTLASLRSAGVDPPDMVGADIMVNSEVAGTVELGWSKKQVAISLSALVVPGWQIHVWSAPSESNYSVFVQAVVRSLAGD